MKKKKKQKQKQKKKKKIGGGGHKLMTIFKLLAAKDGKDYSQLFKTSHSAVLADTNPLAQNVRWKGSISTIEKQKLWTNVEVS